ncbi:MAG: hypothetical protein RDU89_02375 [bacterium]|nr:hypothetical protein [bacterium]
MGDLFSLVRASRLASLAVVGTAKGVGKTLVVDHLVLRAQEEGVPLGLLAGGREGAPDDRPEVYAPRGSLVATAEASLRQGEAHVEVLEVLPAAGPLGHLVVARVREPGRLGLAGPPTAAGLGLAVTRLRAHGAALVLVDGSVDRVASAAPLVTEGTVVATGAAVGGGVGEVAERTRLLLTFLGLPGVADQRLREAAVRAIHKWRVAAVDEDYRPFGLNLRTALGSGGVIAGAVEEGVKALVIAGALVDGVVEALAGMSRGPGRLKVIVPDGTHVFVGSRAWARFGRAGGKVAVLHPIRVVAVTLNPVGPDGLTLDPEELVREVARVAQPLPAFDLVLGRALNLSP